MSNELESIEIELKRKNKHIKIGEALEHLENNNYFQFLIREVYLTSRIINNNKKLSDPYLGEQDKKHILLSLSAASFFSRFLDECSYNASLAKESISETEDIITEILNEEL